MPHDEKALPGCRIVSGWSVWDVSARKQSELFPDFHPLPMLGTTTAHKAPIAATLRPTIFNARLLSDIIPIGTFKSLRCFLPPQDATHSFKMAEHVGSHPVPVCEQAQRSRSRHLVSTAAVNFECIIILCLFSFSG